MKALGYRAALLSKSHFTGLDENIPTLDFSGWPMIVRADMPNDVAYALCEAIEMRRQHLADRQLQAAASWPNCAPTMKKRRMTRRCIRGPGGIMRARLSQVVALTMTFVRARETRHLPTHVCRKLRSIA